MLFENTKTPIHVDGFSDIGETADHPVVGLYFFLFDPGGKKNNRDLAQEGFGPKLGGHVAPIQVWHHHIQEDDVRFEFACRHQAARSEVFLADKIGAGLFKVELEQTGDARLVIDNENFFGNHSRYSWSKSVGNSQMINVL